MCQKAQRILCGFTSIFGAYDGKDASKAALQAFAVHCAVLPSSSLSGRRVPRFSRPPAPRRLFPGHAEHQFHITIRPYEFQFLCPKSDRIFTLPRRPFGAGRGQAARFALCAENRRPSPFPPDEKNTA